jgi:RNA polymerase sigma-70 factor (ECF subfamily)
VFPATEDVLEDGWSLDGSASDTRALSKKAKSSRLEQRVIEFFLALRGPLYGYLQGSLRCPAEAEDLTQEAFLRLFRHLRGGGEVANVRAWLFRVAHRLAIDESRRLQRAGSVIATDPADEEAVSSQERGAEQRVLDAERQRSMEIALGRLSARERQCLELRAEGLRYREIAEVLSIRIPTVQTMLARAVKKIAEVTHE